MIVGRSELWIEIERFLEVLHRFIAAIHHRQKKTDFILEARRFRIERGGLLISGERTGRVAFGFERRGLRFNLLKVIRGPCAQGQAKKKTKKPHREFIIPGTRAGVRGPAAIMVRAIVAGSIVRAFLRIIGRAIACYDSAVGDLSTPASGLS